MSYLIVSKEILSSEKIAFENKLIADTLYMTFTDRLETLIIQKNTKQTALADACGIAQNTISGWKKRGSLPQADIIIKMADFLGVSVHYLVTGKEKGESQRRPLEQNILNDLPDLTDIDLEYAYTSIHAVAEKRREEARSKKTAGL
jgi:transcriptional regulator with XRE-family HTH domain